MTSEFLSGSTGVNAVIIRNVLGQLRNAGIVETRQGSGGAHLARPLDEITLYDIYRAVDCIDDEGLFHFHENPSTDCPVGRNIHKALDEELLSVQSSMEDQMRKIPLSVIVKNTRKEIIGEDGRHEII